MVRLTDRPDMTLDVYRGRKTTMQQQQQSLKNDIYLNNNFMVYLLQLHINAFSEWHLAGASVSYGHFF